MQTHLIEWRRWVGLSQRELAEKAGVAVTTVNEVETGKRQPHPATLRKLAAAFGTDPRSLCRPPDAPDVGVARIRDAHDRLLAALNDANLTPEKIAQGWVALEGREDDGDVGFVWDEVRELYGWLGAIHDALATSGENQRAGSATTWSGGAREGRGADWNRSGVRSSTLESAGAGDAG